MKTTHAAAESTDTTLRGNVPWLVVHGQHALPEHALWASPDLATDLLWALRVAGGTTLAFWGVATLGPVATALAHAPMGHALYAAWFTIAIGMALVASGAMLMTNKLVPLAMTLLLPVGVHLLFQYLVLNG